MNGKVDDDDDIDTSDDVESEETESDDQIVDGVHEATVVDADVESLVAKIDKTDADEAARKREVRRKLEEASERREKDLDQTHNFNIEDEL